MALEVLVVDDEADIRELVSGVLEDEGYAVRTAADSTAALDAIEERRPSLVLLDVWLQGSKLDGLQLLEQIKRRDATLPILMISGHGNLDTAVAAIREGAVDFIEKPFEASRLLHLVDRATETDRLKRENANLRQQVGQEDSLNGVSVAINTVRATLKRVAPTGSRVLITGPAGVGKEVAARTIHQWSLRANAPFIVVSAARMAPERVEEELFGSEAEGVARPGLLEQAHGGTLFLDEIADMPLTTQGKILRVLTDQSYTASAGSARSRSMCACCRRRRATWPTRLPRGGSARICSIASTSSRFAFRRCASGARTFPSWSRISSRGSPPNGGCRRRPCPTKRWPRSRRTTGRAMSASCATSSNGRSSLRRATGSGGSRSTCFHPRCSTIRRASA